VRSESSESQGRYLLTLEAEQALSGSGLLDRLDEVIGRAAIVTHPDGNRRYHEWIFDVRGATVERATRIRRADGEEFVVWEECPECAGDPDLDDGSGMKCSACGGVGEVRVRRRLTASAHTGTRRIR
jgi:hypothetical protein